VPVFVVFASGLADAEMAWSPREQGGDDAGRFAVHARQGVPAEPGGEVSEACPDRTFTILCWTPAFDAAVAWLCRMSCSRKCGSSQRSASRLNRRRTTVG